MTKIHKEVYGQGPSIVLIHGWAMHTGIWREFAQQLGQYFQVTCLDLPGHGLSETVEPYDLKGISRALIKAMPETPVCVLGWSLGASVAIELAVQYPQRIKALVLLAGNPRFIEEDGWAGVKQKMLGEFANNLQLNCQLTLIRFLALQVNSLSNGKELLKQLKQAIQECEAPTEQVLQSGLDILQNADLRPALRDLTCSVTVIQGDKDSLIPLQVSQNIKDLKPESNINIIKGAGHVPFLSHQSQVIDIIKQSI